MSNKIFLDEKEMVRMYESGSTFKEIAKFFNISKDTVRSRMRANGIYLKSGAKEIKVDEEKISSLYLDGKSIDEIIKKIGCTYHVVRQRLIKLNIKRRRQGMRRKIKIDDNYFSILNEDNCYWAGFIASDGNVQGNALIIQLKDIDIKHLEKFRIKLKCDAKISTRGNKIGKDGEMDYSCKISLRSNVIVNNLKEKFNIIPNKSLILTAPNIESENLIRAYIRGYFDGDGCLSRSKATGAFSFEIYSGSVEILEWIKQQIILYVNNIGNTNVKHKKGNTYRFSYSGKKVINIMNWLYKDCEDNYLERKRIKFLNFLEDQNNDS